MSLTLYMNPLSPPVRSTLLTIHALGIQDKVKLVNLDLLQKKEHLKAEFVEKNPAHTIPTLEDGDFVLWDSHAINAYLVDSYAKNDDLYPRDPKKRALVDSMNHFDNGYLWNFGAPYMRSFFLPEMYPDREKYENNVLKALDILEAILERRSFVAGEQITIADFNIVAFISTLVHLLPLNEQKHLKINAWLEKMKMLPYYHVNEEGLQNMPNLLMRNVKSS